ncbi:hypothetical protein E0K89_013315 [Aquicoccus sp. SCR17]|nr:hypothetical protein [Carideicomes alvinocaridis]
MLELVWEGAVQPAEGRGAARLRRLLKAMLPVRIVCLSAATGIDRVTVLPDELEVMPALPLGDVIAEELPVEVPYGSLLLICDADVFQPEPTDAELSYDLGIAVGQTLLTVLRRGIFPLERENEALYVMACAFDRMAQGTALQHLGMVSGEFSKGLAGVLAGYWSGSRLGGTERGGLFLRPGCLGSPELRSYLRTLDPTFAAPAHGRVPAGLLAFPGGTRSFQDWLERVRVTVTGTFSASRRRLIDG